MNPQTSAVRTFSLVPVREVTKLTVVYEAPITVVIAAAHSTMPNTRSPTSPAACSNAEAAWLVGVERRPARDHPEDGEEQDDAHDAGDDDAGDRPAGDVADVLGAGDAGVEQPVRAGVDDVAADGAADQRGDRQEADLLGQHDVLQRLADRGARS